MKKFFSSLLANAVNSTGLRLRWALFICCGLCHVNLLARTVFEIICFPFFIHKFYFYFYTKLVLWGNPEFTKQLQSGLVFLCSGKNIALSVWKSTTVNHFTIITLFKHDEVFAYLQNHRHWDILVFSKSFYSETWPKTPSSWRRFCFALYSLPSAVII